MGASVTLYWPGITEEQEDSDPGFFNDDRAWGNWIAELFGNPPLLSLMNDLGVADLSTHTTEGMADSEVRWVTPKQLAESAERLAAMIRRNDSRVQPLTASYAKSANQIDPVEQELLQDLADVVKKAQTAQELGATRMTFAINW